MIRVLVSDFGGVLTTPLEGSFRAFAQDAGIGLEDLGAAMLAITEREGRNPLYELEVGAVTEADFLRGLGDELSARLGRDVDMADFPEAYFRHLDVNVELLAAMRGWRDGGLRLAMCTNNVREWEPRWRAMLPVDELFEFVVDSAFVGVRKPDRRIYEIVLERLGGVPAEECLFLDDFAHNCEAARELGMTAVHFVATDRAISEVEAALAS